MLTLRLEILSIERKLYDNEVNMVIAPGSEGILGILPRHASLLTALTYGELQVKKEGEADLFFAIGGGFMEVQPYHVIVMADSVERAEEIDIDRAKASRQRAEEFLAKAKTDTTVDLYRAEAALRRSITRIKAAQRRYRKESPHRPMGSG